MHWNTKCLLKTKECLYSFEFSFSSGLFSFKFSIRFVLPALKQTFKFKRKEANYLQGWNLMFFCFFFHVSFYVLSLSLSLFSFCWFVFFFRRKVKRFTVKKPKVKNKSLVVFFFFFLFNLIHCVGVHLYNCHYYTIIL